MRLRDCQSGSKPLASPLTVTGRFFNAFARRGRSGLGQCLLLLALLWCGPASLAQSTNVSSTNTMGLGVTVAPSPATRLQTLTYTLSVTNFYPSVLTGATVTNLLPTGLAALNITATTNSLTGYSTNGSTVVFFLAPLTNLQIVNLTVAVQPTALGSLTNVAAIGQTLVFFGTNPPPVTNITAVVAGHIDLQTTISGPTAGMLVNDRLQYRIAVTNLGPNLATGVFLTNTLPRDATLLGYSPVAAVVTTNATTVIARFDSLAAGTGQQLVIDLQPTRTGLLSLKATANAPGFIEDNASDNSQTLFLVVSPPAAGQLTASLVPPQVFNPQTGLMEQTVRVKNTGTREVPAERVVLSGLTNWLVNATGTNGSNPFIVRNLPLAPGQSADIPLELFVPRRLPMTNFLASALGVSVFFPAPPTGTGAVTNSFTLLPSGQVLVEFPSVAGHWYAVSYGDNIAKLVLAPPYVLASGDVTQWFDYGPPRTVVPPSNAPIRFYRVVELP